MTTAWVRPIPSGRPYQQLGRTDVHRWWRQLLAAFAVLILCIVAAIAVFLGVALLTWVATGRPPELGSGDELFKDAPLPSLVAALGSIAVFLPVVLLVTLVIERRVPGTLSSVAGRIRWRWLAWTFLPAIAYMLAVWGLSIVTDGSDSVDGAWVGWTRFWPALVMILLLVPFQAAAEEYLFRGWMLQAIGSCTFEDRTGRLGRAAARLFRTPWPAIVATSAVFVVGHGYSDWGPADVGVFAVACCWVVILTGGLEAGIALHIVNNVTSMGLDASEGDLSLSQGPVSFTEFLTDAVPVVVWACLIVWMFRHTGSKRPMKRLS